MLIMKNSRTTSIPINELLLKDIFEKSLIQPGCLDISPVRTHSDCEAYSLEEIKTFFAKHEALKTYEMLIERSTVERAVLIATQILGSDCYLTQQQLEQKANYHLLLSVNLIVNWLVDDTLDTNPNISQGLVAELIQFYMAVFTSQNINIDQVHSLKAATNKEGINHNFIDAVYLLLKWQILLASSLKIPTTDSSLTAYITRKFMDTYLKNYAKFNSWEQYESYRTASSGLSILMLYSAYWLCYRWGIDSSSIETNQKHIFALLDKYSVIGGISNDLFGYDKDLIEGVATSVEVVKAGLPNIINNNEALIYQAFLEVIQFHNQRLQDLVDNLHKCDSQTEIVILFSALTTTWAIRILHEKFMKVYQPSWLRKVLLKIQTTNN